MTLERDFQGTSWEPIFAGWVDADSKAIRQIEFVEKLKNRNSHVDHNTSLFVLSILEKIKLLRLNFSQRNVTDLKRMESHEEARVINKYSTKQI